MNESPSSSARPAGTAGVLAGHRVRRVGYGAMQLEFRGRPGGPDRDAALAVLRRAAELGVRHFDTAQFYGHGAVNVLIRAALAPYPDDVVLVSKVGARSDATGLVPAQQPAELRAEVDANLQALGLEQLAVVNLRRVDSPPGLVAAGDQVVALDDQLAELTALRDEGKIGAIGLSSVTLEQLRQAAPAGIACVQNAFSLADQADRPVLAECARLGIAYVPFFPLGSGFPGRPKVTGRPQVIAAAARLQVTPGQIGLAWLLAQGDHVLLIPGTAGLDHLVENVNAELIRLDSAMVADLAAP